MQPSMVRMDAGVRHPEKAVQWILNSVRIICLNCCRDFKAARTRAQTLLIYTCERRRWFVRSTQENPARFGSRPAAFVAAYA